MLYDYIDILKLLTNKEFKDYIENKFDLINTILGKVGILQDQAKDDNRNLDPSIINKILEII
jgi:ribosome assembly protein YihI (activator of Der GTPase)